MGSTPAMIENAIASGMSAIATTKPESTSFFTFPNHCCLIVRVFNRAPLSLLFELSMTVLHSGKNDEIITLIPDET
ncbi:hypothetical protein D479_05940 [Halobacillus sp. BAB-2008]|nr:hypothetical protein D479_05940 [Halobacillus sp. BAB-2008]